MKTPVEILNESRYNNINANIAGILAPVILDNYMPDGYQKSGYHVSGPETGNTEKRSIRSSV